MSGQHGAATGLIRRRRWLAAAMAAVMAASAAVAWPVQVAAQTDPSCAVESEPNDQLVDALPSLAGEACLSGTLPAGPEQDLWLWAVAPEDGLTPWTITVRGVPTTVTGVHVYEVLDAAGDGPLTRHDTGRRSPSRSRTPTSTRLRGCSWRGSRPAATSSGSAAACRASVSTSPTMCALR